MEQEGTQAASSVDARLEEIVSSLDLILEKIEALENRLCPQCDKMANHVDFVEKFCPSTQLISFVPQFFRRKSVSPAALCNAPE